MKQIKLSNGMSVKVDDRDFDYLNGHRWHYGAKGYAVRNIQIDGYKTKEMMHRLITDCPKGMVVDHINHNTLDNRRVNLRVCTPYENSQNRVPYVYKKHLTDIKHYTGVMFNKNTNRWIVRYSVKRKEIYVGSFTSQDEGIEALVLHRQACS